VYSGVPEEEILSLSGFLDAKMKRRIFHLPLERYKERYTEWLRRAERRVFVREGFAYESIMPSTGKGVIEIQHGRVLDTFARPVWALNQVAELMAKSQTGQIAYFSDFYTPGLDALAYAGTNLTLCSFLWAQTFDQYDFTTEMMSWMRPWEVMAFDIYHHVFVAHSMLKELIVAAIPTAEAKIHVVGLPFSTKIVRKKLDPKEVPNEKYDVVYSSRWDKEKNPNLFLDLVAARDDLRFVVCTGHADLRGSDSQAIHRAKRMVAERKNLTVLVGCSKGRYYAVLSRSKVQFNCALQDWVSFTLLEALSFGCSPLYPNFRSFPDTLHYYPDALYVPFDAEDALGKLDNLLTKPFPKSLAAEILAHHSTALNRAAKIMLT
jgi:glycosyltransferase involved in cell wall biosynthesis